MKLLLDECLPRKLKRHLPGHQVFIVHELGWAGINNGALLNLAEHEFDVVITVDSQLRYQQNLAGRKIAIVLLIALSNEIDLLIPLMTSVLGALPTIQPGQFVSISA